jgi:diguanylate cyclase (GGDEF)-like protein
MRHKDGRWLDVETAVTTMYDDPGVRGLVLNSRDITERMTLEAELRTRAWHDPLTGLANRALFSDRVDNALARRSRDGRPLAVAFLDLDDFKSINDTLGHTAGDLLLRGIGERLVEAVRPGDTVARFGGDEFALLFEGADAVTAQRIADRIIHSLLPPFQVLAEDVHARASIGVVLGDGHETSEDLLSAADTAMYVAKARGKSRVEFFEPQMRAVAVERSGLRTDLEWALPRDELDIYYQPVVDIPTGTRSGACWHLGSSSTWPRRAASSSPSAAGCCGGPASRPCGGVASPAGTSPSPSTSLPASSRTRASWARSAPPSA